MGINKVCPKIIPFVKIRNRNELPCVQFALCLLLSAVWSHFEAVLTGEVVLPVRLATS